MRRTRALPTCLLTPTAPCGHNMDKHLLPLSYKTSEDLLSSACPATSHSRPCPLANQAHTRLHPWAANSPGRTGRDSRASRKTFMLPPGGSEDQAPHKALTRARTCRGCRLPYRSRLPRRPSVTAGTRATDHLSNGNSSDKVIGKTHPPLHLHRPSRQLHTSPLLP